LDGKLRILLSQTLSDSKLIQRTFTDVDIHNEEILADVENFNKSLWGELRYEVNKKNLSSLNLDEVELVLEPRRDDYGVLLCGYYFVNPASRSLFWLDGWTASQVFESCRGVDTLSHKGESHPQDLTALDLHCELNYSCHRKDWQFKLCTGTSQW